MVSRRLSRFVPQLDLLESRETPATIAWVGDVDGNWATNTAGNTNWAGDVLPTATDDLLFDDTAVGNFSSTNDLLTSVQAISFAGTTNSFTLAGNALTLTGLAGTAISNASSRPQVVNMPLTLGGDLGIDSSSTDVLAGLFLSGALSDGGALTKTGGGRLTLQADNSAFTGQILIDAGTLVANNVNALGSTAAGTTVAAGATLELAAGGTYAAEPLTLNGSGVPGVGGVGVGALFNTASSAIFTGPITLASNSVIGPGNSSGDVLTLSGGIGESGAGRTLRIDSDGAGPVFNLTLRLSAPATYTGLTTVNRVAFTLQNTTMAGGLTLLGGQTFSGLGTIAGPVTNNTFMFLGLITDPVTGDLLPGVLNTGDLTFDPNGAASAVTIGNTVGTGSPYSGHGQVRVTGTVDLTGNGGLQVINWPGGTLLTTPLQPLVLIANDGTDPIIGEFDGRGEGVIVSPGPLQFQVTYKGGDGNDFAFRPIIATSVTLTSSTPNPVFGQPVTFTATVQALRDSATPPGGEVVLLDNGVPLAVGTLDATGSATFTVSNLPVGGNGLTVVYKGTINTRLDLSAFQNSTSDALNLFVATPTAVASVSTSPASSVVGQPVTINAVVAGAAPSGATPTGLVDFFDGTTYLGTRVLVGGAASFVTTLVTGAHPLSVVYHGDANFTAVASPAFTHIVARAATATTLAAAVNPSTTGSVNLSAAISVLAPGGGTPTGTVSFFDGGALLGVGNLINGTATLTAIGLAPGAHTLTAVYTGDANFADSAAPPVTHTVTPPSPPPQPAPTLAGGVPGGTAVRLDPAEGGYQLGEPIPFFPGFTGTVRTAVADVTGDGIPDLIGGTGPGGGPRVVVLDGATGGRVADFFAFEPTFTGGVFVAAADLDGDGKAEVVVTPDQGGGPVVAVFDRSGAERTRFFGIDDPNFRGGARPALGDINGDSTPDLIVSAGIGGGPRVAIFDGTSVLGGGSLVKLMGDFFVFEDTLRNGAFVAAGDVNGDGVADVAFGGGPGGAPRVRLFDGKALLAAGPFSNLDAVPTAQRADFFAGDSSLRGGVRLVLRDADGDGKADLVTGSGEGEPSRVQVYRSANLLANPAPTADQELDPFGAVLADGVFVG